MIDELVTRLRAEYVDAVAVLLKGSMARGEAHSWSDVDFDLLVSTPATEIYRTWLVPNGERLVHVSVAVETLENWLADADEPSSWSLGLPTAETTQLLWAASDDVRELLDRPAKLHPAAEPEVEDAVEALGKMRSALTKDDRPGLYRNAEKLGRLIPTLLVPLNDVPPVANSRKAIAGVLALQHVPEGFADDWLTCMGYVDSRTPESTLAAAERMLFGTLAMIPPDDDEYGEDILAILNNGSLMRYLEQH
ncbi:MAG: hypothetical protein KC435_04090 [Thermomicrobiales bacterium]|nr:hypothetical protein [Thermomicrobiales bacterium]